MPKPVLAKSGPPGLVLADKIGPGGTTLDSPKVDLQDQFWHPKVDLQDQFWHPKVDPQDLLKLGGLGGIMQRFS